MDYLIKNFKYEYVTCFYNNSLIFFTKKICQRIAPKKGIARSIENVTREKRRHIHKRMQEQSTDAECILKKAYAIYR